MKSGLILAIALASFITTGAQKRDDAFAYQKIEPLKSTRADVERLLGRPADRSNPTYYFPDRVIGIQYSKYGCTLPPRVEGWPVPPAQGWNVPPDTVLVVRVTLRKRVSLKSLKLDLKPFIRESRDPHMPTQVRYVDRESGLTIELNGDSTTEIVRALIYEPGAKYNSFRCPEKSH